MIEGDFNHEELLHKLLVVHDQWLPVNAKATQFCSTEEMWKNMRLMGGDFPEYKKLKILLYPFELFVKQLLFPNGPKKAKSGQTGSSDTDSNNPDA